MSSLPAVPPWATSLLSGSQRSTPSAATKKVSQPTLEVDRASVTGTPESSPEILPVEMDDEDDEDYNLDDEEDDDEDDDIEAMSESQKPGLPAARPLGIPSTMSRTYQIPQPGHEQLAPKPATSAASSSRGQGSTMSSRLLSRAQEIWKQRDAGTLPGQILPVAVASPSSSSSGGSDIPAFLPPEQRASRSSLQSVAEISASFKRDGADPAGPAAKRPRVSNVADGVITSRLNENDLLDALQSRRYSTTVLTHSTPDAPETNLIPTVPSGVAAKPGEDLGIPPHLETAADGRPYGCAPGHDPNKKSKGALFPTGYVIRQDTDLPWTCPVRDCQNLLPTLSGLGSHISTVHDHSVFNDNLDGTMSLGGRYKGVRWARAPPVIVSRGPPGPREPPPVEAAATKWTMKRLEQRTSTKASIQWWDDPNLAQLEPSERPKGSELFFYLKGQVPDGTPISTQGHLGAMLRLKPKRIFPLRWGPNASPRGLHTNGLILLTAYLTGAKTKYLCQHSINSTYRFDCVVPAEGSPEDLKKLIGESCVLCCYFNYVNEQHTHPCNLQNTGAVPLSRPSQPARPSVPSFGTTDDSPLASDMGDFDRPNQTQQPVQRPVQQPVQQSVQTAPPDTATDASSLQAKYPSTRAAAAAAVVSRAPKTDSPSAAVSDNVPSVDMLEMESWEVAPGHIRDDSGADPEQNVAFSNAYITSNSAVPISADVGFNVATIKPGGSYRLEANSRVLRVCSVASGKVRVKLDEKKFQIGRNGVFKVRGGSTVTVENRLYVDSVLHISTIDGY